VAGERYNKRTVRKGKDKPYYMYVLRCSDDSLYCGVSTDPTRRLKEHNESARGAKYTRSRRPCKLLFTQECKSKSDAYKKEAAFKKLRKLQKYEYMCQVIDEEMLAQIAQVEKMNKSNDAINDAGTNCDNGS